MTDEEFIKKVEAFDFVEEVNVIGSCIDIMFKDDYLDYNSKTLATTYKNGNVNFKTKLLQTIELDKRKEFIKLVYAYSMQQEKMAGPQKKLLYDVVSKEDRRHLIRNREKKCFGIKYYDFPYSRFELTKEDLEKYKKEEKFGPLSTFNIKVSD